MTEDCTCQQLELRLAEAARQGQARLAFVPVGCCEQHGPHLPLQTDTIIAQAVAEALERRSRKTCVGYVFPAVPYSPTRSNLGYCGTVSVDESLFRQWVDSICQSLLAQPFDAVVLVNGHGPAGPSLVEVAFKLNHEQAIQSPGARVQPVLVMDVPACQSAISAALAMAPGRHADWREALLIYHILKQQWFTTERSEALVDFQKSHQFAVPKSPWLGMPVADRSIEGVIGDPMPWPVEQWASHAERAWEITVDILAEKLQSALDAIHQKEAGS